MIRLLTLFIVFTFNPSPAHSQMNLSYPVNLGNFKEELIEHSFYALGYSEEHEQARWVSYELHRDHMKHCTKRRNDFRPDPDVSTGSADESDYRRSGYSRGHMVPAGDRLFNNHAMRETFYFSNMSPQLSSFNGGIWNELERLIRGWAIDHGVIKIITGPVLRPGLKKIGNNEVSVPEYFYKVVLRTDESGRKMAAAFLMPHEKSKDEVADYAVSINELEDIIGLDLFDGLLTETEEDQIDLSPWDFQASYKLLPCR